MRRTSELVAVAAMLAVLAASGWARAEAAPEDEAEEEAAVDAQEEGAPSARPLRRSRVMEYHPLLIKGQPPGSGLVYLFKRAPRSLPELVRLRTTYRSRIVSPVLGADRPPAADRPAGGAAPPARRDRRDGEEEPPACVEGPPTPTTPRPD